MFNIDVKSLLAPLLYVVIVFGGLYVFSTLYKRYNAGLIIEPYFPRHKERDIYVSLLQLSDPPAAEQLLKAALVRRAMTDVQRILRIREDKPVIQALMQKGSLGDDVMTSIQAAEKELESEILEVAQEANSYVEGWGQIIFQTATEILQTEKMRSLLEQLPNNRAEKEKKYNVKRSSKSLSATRSPPTPSLSPTINSLAPSVPEDAASSESEVPAPPTPRTPKSAKKKQKRR